MGATVFVQPLDLVKNRMQLSGKSEWSSDHSKWNCSVNVLTVVDNLCVGEGGAVRQHKTSLHAIARVIRDEGFFGIYNGYVLEFPVCCYSDMCMTLFVV